MAAAGTGVNMNDVKEAVTCGICLQIYTDPRYLRCSHTFCLKCLDGYQNTSTWKECPVCRVDCIPSQKDLEKLPVNQLAINLVGLVKTYEPDAVDLHSFEEPQTEWTKPPKPEPKQKPSLESTTSRRSSSSSDSSDASGVDGMIGRLAQLHSLMGDGLGDLVGRDRQDLIRELVDESVSRMLTGGSDEDSQGGMTTMVLSAPPVDAELKASYGSVDFDMCSKCAAKPRGMVHDPEHIFVKLKKPSVTPPPRGQILHEDSVVMGMSMDTNKKEHVLEYGGATIKYECQQCHKTPITGTRYKCGNCHNYNLCSNCEKKSQDIHDDKHVFLEIQHPTGLHTTKPQLTWRFYT